MGDSGSIDDTAVGPDDPLERAALQRVMARLVPRQYQPVRLGRFVLLEELGVGGMGVVHAGYDETLDRRVALKLIGSGRATSEQARRRLFREAQAMAKLNHPNVVQVFDAGEQDGHVYIAMELVEGRTLRAWNLEVSPRPWREVVRMFQQIGEGLAAAHAAGVVHRDFKPDNVLIGRDARPKVADFGLATLELPMPSAADSTAGASALSGSNPALPEGLLTATGEVLGTPAYMAPEQYIDQVSDPASDQFSYCIALHEALWGQRPFAGDTLSEIMSNIVAGRVRGVASGHEVPAWVRAIVLRGLAPKRRDRFASMHELLTALADDPQVRRRRALGRAAAVIGVVGTIGAAVVVNQTRTRPCADVGQQIDAVWSDDVRARIDETFAATGLPYAADTAQRVGTALDRYGAAWSAGALDACEATRIRSAQSESAMDLRTACLGRARVGLSATVAELTSADAAIVEHAMALVGALPSIERCGDLEALRADVAPPDDPVIAAAAEALWADLLSATVAHVAGKLDQAEAALVELRASAAELGVRPLQSAVDEALATLFVSRGDDAEAEGLYRSALAGSLADGDDTVAIKAASGLVMLLGGRGTRFAEAQWLGEVALALADRRSHPAEIADVQNSLGALAVRQGRYDAAEAAFRLMLELFQGEYGEDQAVVAVAHENLGTVLLEQGRREDGLEEHRRALEIRQKVFGPEHPLIGLARVHLGTALQELGRYEEAEAELREGTQLLTATLGPDHDEVAMGHANLGVVLDERGRHREAQASYRHAIAILERTRGPNHPEVAMGYNNLGTSFEDEGDLAGAEAEFRRALAISEKAFGEDHPDVARTRGNLSSVLIKLRRFDEAVDEAESAITISRKVLAADHPDLRYAYAGGCRAHFEQAKDLAPRDPKRASASAEVAERECEAAGDSGRELAESLRQWRARPKP